MLERMRVTGRLVRGRLRPPEPGYGDVQYCDVDVLRRLRRGSLARLRAEVEPVEPVTLGRFLPAWHGIGAGNSASTSTAPAGPDELLDVVEQLAGAPIVASALESLVLPARLPGYIPALLDELTAAGEVSWTGCGALGGNDGWIALAPADLAEMVLPEPDLEALATPVHRAVYTALEDGALFFRDLSQRGAALLAPDDAVSWNDAAVLDALWDLLWAGLISNDTLGPLRARLGERSATHPVRRTPRARYGRLRSQNRPTSAIRLGPPTATGRWSRLPEPETDATKRAHARAQTLLQRHGVLTRGALSTERGAGGFSGVYRVLRAMEEAGQCRRGYVVEGLGAAQFAVPGAIDQLRSFAVESEDVDSAASRKAVLLAATDPAQPYGAALPWPDTLGDGKHRPGRKAGAVMVLVDGVPALYAERGGRSLLTFTIDHDRLQAAARRLAVAVTDGRIGPLTVERINGDSVNGGDAYSTLSGTLTEAGFRVTPKGFRLRA
jgi:ATP-dependent Lhr-like helicase